MWAPLASRGRVTGNTSKPVKWARDLPTANLLPWRPPPPILQGLLGLVNKVVCFADIRARDVSSNQLIIPNPENSRWSLMQECDFQQLVVQSRIPRCSRGVVADPCHETVGANLTEGYSIGETDVECRARLWKARASDPEVDGEEWVTFLECIQEHFRTTYENFPDEFYFWGDFSGDRTLDLKIAKPTVLAARLLSDLQIYLQTNGQRMWRIRIPIYFKPNDPHRVVVVYPHAIDIPPVLRGVSAEKTVVRIRPVPI
jgi:hypothetical protein